MFLFVPQESWDLQLRMFGYITCGFLRIFGYVLQVIKYSISVPLDQGGFGGWNLMLTALNQLSSHASLLVGKWRHSRTNSTNYQHHLWHPEKISNSVTLFAVRPIIKFLTLNSPEYVPLGHVFQVTSSLDVAMILCDHLSQWLAVLVSIKDQPSRQGGKDVHQTPT